MEQVLTENDKVRNILRLQNITSENINIEMIKELVEILNKHLKESGIYHGTATIDRLRNAKFITMSTEDWEGREAVSFNSDGFIGFCGWADSKNSKPILNAVTEWALNHREKQFNLHVAKNYSELDLLED
ncbi:hypothetical protein [Arcobacter arenosus]|uniref:Uncharacterized protein n=1 Tax=Arcobacter arenosus TaxID=2576037 RepID=A0A5R8Y5X1_9BACT|nr:hypothetical protein [Arcobacter arenosus]TLP41063.1 hypothetical protein FDK22_03315 [Arcobacter arenosus]